MVLQDVVGFMFLTLVLETYKINKSPVFFILDLSRN